MPAFGSRSRLNLSQCHPDLRTLFEEVIKVTDCAVICGERGRAEQETAFHQGKSNARWPRSYHNVDGVTRKTSWAADVVPWPLDWGNQARFVALADVVIDTARRLYAEGAIKHEVRWGGDWDRDGEWRDERFVDMPHYELIGVPDGE